jgi:hypothetical protein
MHAHTFFAFALAVFLCLHSEVFFFLVGWMAINKNGGKGALRGEGNSGASACNRCLSFFFAGWFFACLRFFTAHFAAVL